MPHFPIQTDTIQSCSVFYNIVICMVLYLLSLCSYKSNATDVLHSNLSQMKCFYLELQLIVAMLTVPILVGEGPGLLVKETGVCTENPVTLVTIVHHW